MNHAALAALTLVMTTAPAAAAAVDPSILDAIRKIKPADYPSANTVVIASDQAIVYQRDGQFTATVHDVRLVLTQEGKAAASSLPLNYTRDAEKMEVLTARVIKADGSVVPVGPSGIKDTEQSGEMNIYDPMGRSLQVTFDGLAPGDAAEVTFRMTRLLPTRPGFFNDTFAFQGTEPMLEGSYDIDGPADLPLTSTIYHPERGARVTASRTRQNDRIRYRWTVRNAPQLVPEALMNGTTELPLLVVTTDPSWEHFSSWWASVTEPQLEVGPALAARTAELVKGAGSDEQKIKALYDFVASDVRYRGLGVGPRTGYTPRKANDTYASRWGVCRDVAILLTAMLRQAGFQAHPVLTNVGDPVLDKIAYDGFNHAIVAMPDRAAPGGWTFLDPTAKNSSDLLPGYEREQHALVSTRKGEPLRVIPPVAPAANMGHVVTRSQVGRDGSLSSEVTIESKGALDLVLRSMAATMPREQLRQTAEQIVHGSLPDARLVRFEVSDPLALQRPMQMELRLEVPTASVQAGDFRLLRTVVTSGALGLDAWLGPALGGLASRKYTLDARSTLQWSQDEVISLPPGMKVQALPNDAHSANAVSQVDSHCGRSAGGTISCHRSFQIKTRFIDPAKYAELRQVLSDVAILSRQPVILEDE
jgi:hypothetical protein